jgi:signal transduction histidine kinase
VKLNKITVSARELIDNLGNLIWSNNPSNDSLKKLLQYLREHMGNLFDDTNVRFDIVLPELHAEFPVPATWRRNVFLAIKESLHNILKHANANTASLTCTIKENMLLVSITDDGSGFEPLARQTHGNGLLNIRKRVTDCGGSVTITSKPGNGTHIAMIFPIPD